MTLKTIKKVKAFLNASNDNREFEAYLAYKERIPWPYFIRLESVVAYLKFHKKKSSDDSAKALTLTRNALKIEAYFNETNPVKTP